MNLGAQVRMERPVRHSATFMTLVGVALGIASAIYFGWGAWFIWAVTIYVSIDFGVFALASICGHATQHFLRGLERPWRAAAVISVSGIVIFVASANLYSAVKFTDPTAMAMVLTLAGLVTITVSLDGYVGTAATP